MCPEAKHKFRNKYRIETTRLQNWDYGWNAAYFVTICTKNREHYFGYVIDGKMNLSEIGRIADKYWLEISTHFSFVYLDEYVIMPNHVHGIIIIDKPDIVDTPNLLVVVDTPNLGVSTTTNNKWKPGTLGVIINQYKRICTIQSRKIHPDFEWQSRFYDHVIRNDKSFDRITNYIQNNPLKWKEDQFHSEIDE